MDNLWYNFLVEKFAEEKCNVRTCGSCMGGCLHVAECLFICCGVPVSKFKEWVDENKTQLKEEFDKKMEKEMNECLY